MDPAGHPSGELRNFQGHRGREHAPERRAACASCIGTRPPSGPTCSTAPPGSLRSIRRDVASSTTLASAISGISQGALRIRFRGWIRTAANSCWCSMIGDFDEDNTFLLSDWFKHTPGEVRFKISAFPVRPSPTFRIQANSIFFLRRCRGRSIPTRWWARPRCRPGPQPQDAGARADQDQKRHGTDYRHQCVPGIHDDLGGTRGDRARRHA